MQIIVAKCHTRAVEPVHKSGIVFPGWTPDTIDLLRQWWTDGISTMQIGKRLGISKNAVTGKVHRLNLPCRPSPIRHGVERKRRRVRRASAITLATVSPPQPITKAPQPKIDKYRGRCCFPIGEPGKPSFRFCDDPALDGRPYCLEHCKVAYVDFQMRRLAFA